MPAKLIDLTGQTYGYLTVISLFEKSKHGLRWLCKCSCGNEAIRHLSGLRGHPYCSCGCMRSKHKITHNESNGKSTEYTIYSLIKARCYNPKNHAYNRYGGRGIVMCDRWLSDYKNFISDMGRRPSLKHSIDRINVNGNYEPNNCRWATKVEQANNTRSNRYIEYNGAIKTLAQWCEALGIPVKRTGYRLRNGWGISKAFETGKLVNQYSLRDGSHNVGPLKKLRELTEPKHISH